MAVQWHPEGLIHSAPEMNRLLRIWQKEAADTEKKGNDLEACKRKEKPDVLGTVTKNKNGIRDAIPKAERGNRSGGKKNEQNNKNYRRRVIF